MQNIMKNNILMSDKFKYTAYYESIFDKNNTQNVLEIGVGRGGSIFLWRKFFPNIKHLVGIDRGLSINKTLFSDFGEFKNLSKDDYYERYTSQDGIIDLFMMDAYDKRSVEIIRSVVPDFDLIIDDGNHTLEQWKSFIDYYDSLSSNGLLILEDVCAPFLEELSNYSKDYKFVCNETVVGDPHFITNEVIKDMKLKFQTAEWLYVNDKRKKK